MPVSVRRRPLRIGERADGSEVVLPLIEYRGPPGPAVFIGAGIHGDELTGQASIWKLHEYLRDRRIRGTVTIMPAMNPEGLNYDIRGMPEADVDLNRLYPGRPRGPLAERITSRIWTIASRHDMIIDLHTNGRSLPFVLIDPVTGELKRRTDELAFATGLTVLEELAAEDYAAENLGASLGGVSASKGIPSITIELGGGRAIDWGTVDAGYVALTNVLSYAKVIDAPPKPVRSSIVIRERGYRRQDVWCGRGGLIEYVLDLGKRARKGALVARIRDVYGDVAEEVRMPEDGYMISQNSWHVSQTGLSIATIAVKNRA